MTRQEIEVLVAEAEAVLGPLRLRRDLSAGGVAAAVRTSGGRVVTGVCLDLACGVGFCAEHAAVAEMLKGRETRVLACVAVTAQGIVPPCGRCRELLAQLDPANMDAEIVLAEDRAVPLRQLLPESWLDGVP